MHRLKTNGWIEDYWAEHERERRRRYYRITPEGVKALEAEKKKWMTVHGVLAQLWELPEAGPSIP